MKLKKIIICLFLLSLCSPVFGGVDLNGDEDYGTISNVFDPNTGAYAIFMWVKIDTMPTGGGDKILVHQNNGSGSAGRTTLTILDDSNSEDNIATGMGGAITRGTTALSTGIWYHVGVNWASGGSGQVDVYLNGSSDASSTKDPEACDGDHYIGQHKNGNSFFDGMITDIVFIDGGVTSAEAMQLYQSKLKRFALQIDGVEEYFPLDDLSDGASLNGQVHKGIVGGNDLTWTDGDDDSDAIAEKVMSYTP